MEVWLWIRAMQTQEFNELSCAQVRAVPLAGRGRCFTLMTANLKAISFTIMPLQKINCVITVLLLHPAVSNLPRLRGVAATRNLMCYMKLSVPLEPAFGALAASVGLQPHWSVLGSAGSVNHYSVAP